MDSKLNLRPVIVPASILQLSSDSTSEEIIEVVGGLSTFLDLLYEIDRRRIIAIDSGQEEPFDSVEYNTTSNFNIIRAEEADRYSLEFVIESDFGKQRTRISYREGFYSCAREILPVQAKLIAGDNVTIEEVDSDDLKGAIISVSIPEPPEPPVPPEPTEISYTDLTDKPVLNGEEINGNQDLDHYGIQAKLTAGKNITIANNVISSTGGSGSRVIYEHMNELYRIIELESGATYVIKSDYDDILCNTLALEYDSSDTVATIYFKTGGIVPPVQYMATRRDIHGDIEPYSLVKMEIIDDMVIVTNTRHDIRRDIPIFCEYINIDRGNYIVTGIIVQTDNSYSKTDGRIIYKPDLQEEGIQTLFGVRDNHARNVSCYFDNVEGKYAIRQGVPRIAFEHEIDPFPNRLEYTFGRSEGVLSEISVTTTNGWLGGKTEARSEVMEITESLVIGATRHSDGSGNFVNFYKGRLYEFDMTNESRSSLNNCKAQAAVMSESRKAVLYDYRNSRALEPAVDTDYHFNDRHTKIPVV